MQFWCSGMSNIASTKTFLSIFVFILIMVSAPCYANSHSSSHISAIQPNQDYTKNIDHYIYSDYTGRNYSLKVLLPTNYNASNTYPTMLFMDYLTFNRYGNVFDLFFYISNSYYEYNSTGAINDLILVNILNSDFTQQSYDDFLNDMTDGAGNTFNFLEKELIPFLSTKYSVNDNNITLAATDYGANMVLQSFFDFPNSTISNFESIDGVFNDNEDLYFMKEQQYYEWSQTHQQENRTLLVTLDTSSTQFKSGLRIMRNLLERGYQNQNIFAPIIQESFIYYLILDGYYYITSAGVSPKFQSDIDIEYLLGDRKSPSYYANETIEFIFFGNAAFHTLTYNWYVDDILVGTDNILTQEYSTIGYRNVTLVLQDENGNEYISSKQINIQAPPIPPFDFQTVESTTLNTGSYKTKSISKQVLDFPSIWIYLFVVLFIPVLRIKRLRKL